MPCAHEIREEVQERGFAIAERVVEDELIEHLLRAVGRHEGSESSLRRRGGVFAQRNLLEVPEVVDLANSNRLRELVRPVLGESFIPVRGILFDKTPEANWKVPWHQDLTIAVRGKIDVEGFGPWSMKAGVLHVQPPVWVLEKMLTVRLHLDDCGETNGALRVVPGSHRQGRIGEDQIRSAREKHEDFVCRVGRGGALLMRPLLLHASSACDSPAHRRVVHVDFAAGELPGGLRWDAEPTARLVQG